MKIDHCRETVSVKKIVLGEKGKKATFLNEPGDAYIRTLFDGCVPKEGLKADYILSKEKMGCVIVELKGRNIEHAFKQIKETAYFWHKNKFCCGKLSGLVVSTGIPSSSTTIQRAKQEFTRSFKGKLRVVSGNREFLFESLF